MTRGARAKRRALVCGGIGDFPQDDFIGLGGPLP